MAVEKSKPKASAKAPQVPAACDAIYTTAQAAFMLQVTERVLLDKFRDGEIRAYKKFRQWYTLHSHLVAYLQG